MDLIAKLQQIINTHEITTPMENALIEELIILINYTGIPAEDR